MNSVGDAGPVLTQPRYKAAIYFHYQILGQITPITILFRTREHAANALRKVNQFSVDGVDTILVARSDSPDDLALVSTENFVYAEIVELPDMPLMLSPTDNFLQDARKRLFEIPEQARGAKSTLAEYPLPPGKMHEYEEWKKKNPTHFFTFEEWLFRVEGIE